MADLFRYAAFISYSSGDARFAQRLHRALERYGIPASLGTFDLIGGGRKNRVYPVFRDREELAAGSLGERIEAALRASAALVVVCSPKAAASPWVEKEIQYFVGLGRANKVFAIIADDAPLLDDAGKDATPACFPPSFRVDALQDAGALEPLAADARKGKDGFRNAWLKLVAGMIGVTPGQIIDRDRRRRRQIRRLWLSAGGATAAVAALAGAMFDARTWRSDMTSRANDLTSQGRALDATPFALAGLSARGDLLRIVHPEAQSALLRTGGLLPIRADLGPLSEDGYVLSPGGRFLIAQRSDGETMLHDLAGAGGSVRPLGFLSSVVFSADDRFLVMRDLDEQAALLDLDANRTPRPLGDLAYYEFSPDGRFLLTAATGARRGDWGDHALYDLDAPDAAPLQLGALAGREFSPDGRYLVARDQSGAHVVHDLRAQAPPRRLGRLLSYEFSPDGRRLLIQTPDGAGALVDLERTDAQPRPLGPVSEQGAAFSPDGRFLLLATTPARLIDLDAAVGAHTDIGAIGLHQFSPNSRFLLATHGDDGTAILRDLAHPDAAPRALGEVAFARFSPDGRFLVTNAGVGSIPGDEYAGVGALYDLQASADAAPAPLGNLVEESFALSNDSRFLLTQGPDGAGVLYELAAMDRPPRPVGPLMLYEFSSDSRFLMIVTPDEAGALRALPPMQPGESVRADVCRASGAQVRPLMRSESGGERASASARLIGRPWNPCDWRGLAAILPSAEHGDGWFEGLRQWLRLMSIRHFAGSDWTCAETTSRASAETRALRADMCDRMTQAADAGAGDAE